MKKTLTVIIMLIAFIGLGAAGCTQDTGNATIKPKPVELETPVAADFDISGLSAVYDGTPKTVSIRPKEGKSRGRIIVYYKGIEGTAYAINTAAPLAVGNYDVTFDVLAAEGFNAVTLRAGTLVIIGEQITGALIPVESDFDISGLQALANGKPKAVTISPKEGKSQGQISVYYEGANGTVYAKSADAPSEAGKYAVTFDLTEAEGFYAASGLSAGTLVISQIKTFNVDFEDQIWSDGNKGYAERTVTYRRYRWLISGVGTMDAGDRRSGARSLRLRGNNGDNCRIESITFFESGIESVSFDYASYSTHSGGRITLSYQIDGNHDNEDEDGGKDAEWIAIGEVTAPAWSGYMQKAIFENLGIAESARVKIAREGGPANYTTVNIDNIIISSLSSEPDNKGGDDSDLVTLNPGDLSIHFLELGNKYTGDCVYINYGDIDILIDAGSKQSSAATIKAYIDNFTQDDKLEYVIATHAHEDHIAGFYSTKTVTGILDSYEIGIIIDFPKTNSTSATYNNYQTARANAVAKGAVHYTALQCFNNEGSAQRVYDLGGGVELEILYNYYYENNSGSENDYSVCVRINRNGEHYLFTGDLERNGEDRLVDYYAANFGGLGQSVLHKGGHHGSVTSNNVKLMEAISPEYIIITTCAGSSEYGANPPNVFPSQAFIDRIAPYTDKVYVTTYVPDYANNKYESMNGDIAFVVSDGGFKVKCSNNNLKLKETEWFIKNRAMPAAWK